MIITGKFKDHVTSKLDSLRQKLIDSDFQLSTVLAEISIIVLAGILHLHLRKLNYLK